LAGTGGGGCQFQDLRHGKRFRSLLGQLSGQIGGSIPFACQDWAATKAAYRFLSNERIDEEKILAGHFHCTQERTAGTQAGPVLVLHDTTEFAYRREDPYAIGIIQKRQTRYDSRPRYHTTSGVLTHSSLVVTQDARPTWAGATEQHTHPISHKARQAGRLSGSSQRPSTRKHRHVERTYTPHRHPARLHPWHSTCG